LKDTLKISFFDLSSRIKLVTIYKHFISNHDFSLYNFFKSVVKEPEPEQERELEPELEPQSRLRLREAI
jgi:hypothetical protein